MRKPALFAAFAAGSRCKGCGRDGTLLCGTCARSAAAGPTGETLVDVDRLVTCWAYEGAPRALLLDLKLRGIRLAADPLARGLVDLVRRMGTRAAIVTWVPGRPDGNRERGFDHAEVIARRAAAELGLPVAQLLTRRAGSADQSGLSRSQRVANLRDAFTSRPIRGWVLLVDDVVTSGASVESCALALKRSGCEGVEVAGACRA